MNLESLDTNNKCILLQVYTSMGNEECSMGFFLKLLPSAAILNGDKNRNVARNLNVFPKEVRMTFGLLPQVNKLSLSKGLKLAIPEIVYGSHDNKGNGVVVVISEEKRGYISPRHYSGLTLLEVSAVIDRISEVHAASTAMFMNTTSAQEWQETLAARTQEEDMAFKDDITLVFRSLTHFLKRVPGYLDLQTLVDKVRPALIEVACQAQNRLVLFSFIKKYDELKSSHLQNYFFSSQIPFHCLIHGELYERNLIFRQTRRSKSGTVTMTSSPYPSPHPSLDFTDEDEEEEDELKIAACGKIDTTTVITDWKYSSVSSPNVDLAFFLLSSTNLSMREKYTQDWLEQYYFSFTECLRAKFNIKLGNVFPDFDFDVFCMDFESHLYKAYLQVGPQTLTIQILAPLSL
jgi:thiamine kinase-like enzyme